MTSEKKILSFLLQADTSFADEDDGDNESTSRDDNNESSEEGDNNRYIDISQQSTEQPYNEMQNFGGGGGDAGDVTYVTEVYKMLVHRRMFDPPAEELALAAMIASDAIASQHPSGEAQQHPMPVHPGKQAVEQGVEQFRGQVESTFEPPPIPGQQGNSQHQPVHHAPEPQQFLPHELQGMSPPVQPPNQVPHVNLPSHHQPHVPHNPMNQVSPPATLPDHVPHPEVPSSVPMLVVREVPVSQVANSQYQPREGSLAAAAHDHAGHYIPQNVQNVPQNVQASIPPNVPYLQQAPSASSPTANHNNNQQPPPQQPHSYTSGIPQNYQPANYQRPQYGGPYVIIQNPNANTNPNANPNPAPSPTIPSPPAASSYLKYIPPPPPGAHVPAGTSFG